MIKLSNTAKKVLHYASNRRHAAGSLEISRFVFTTPIDHTYAQPHLCMATCFPRLPMRTTTTDNNTAVRPAVQLLLIQEVHTWPHFNVQFTSCLHPVSSTGTISAQLHFYGSKQRPTERTALLLSSRSCFIARRRP